jgi:3-isopropylmalate dehydrogenase
MNAQITLLPGDGIGPEIVGEARRVLEAVGQKTGHAFAFDEQRIGGIAIDQDGTPLPESTLASAKKSHAVLLGAVGGPKWDDPKAKLRPEQGLLGIRKALGLWANLRPTKVIPALRDASPLKADRLEGVDMLLVRELTGGIYFGERGRQGAGEAEKAFDTMIYSVPEIRRVVRLGFQLAGARRKLVTSVDKANVLESSRLWRQVAVEVGRDFPDVKLEHQLVDSAAMRLVTAPASFDVVVTENMFGDILSDEAAVLPGTLGMMPSASLGEGPRGLYEPIHGSAPDIAGKSLANPLGTILSAAMMLRHSLSLEAEARLIEGAVEKALLEGHRTKDMGGSESTRQVTDAVLARL